MSERGTSVEPSGAGTPAHPIMFWVLTTMAVATFAPCVLLPIWVEARAVQEYERSMAALVADFEDQIEKNDARITALLADPLVNKRIIRRELNYHADGEQLVEWTADELALLRTNHCESVPQDSADSFTRIPAWLKSLRQWLPAWPWEDIFGKSPNRLLLLLMSGGLLGAAFLLYGTKPCRKPPRIVTPD